MRCRKAVLKGMKKAFDESDQVTLEFYDRICIEFYHYKHCMRKWNDQNKYQVHRYRRELLCETECAFDVDSIRDQALKQYPCVGCTM